MQNSVLQGEFEVFLSFCGDDTRHNITEFLCESLEEAGIQTFKDDVKLPKGEGIERILQAIEQSKICIPIFSKNYASREWCLRELAKMVECSPVILPIFYDVKPSTVRDQLQTYEEALLQHQKQFDKESIQKWREALKSVALKSGWDFEKEFKGHQKKLVDTIVLDVLEKLKKFNSHESCRHLLPTTIASSEISEKTCRVLESLKKEEVSAIGIYGMAGVGKTTLALHIRTQLLESLINFKEVYWMTVSRDCSIYHLQKTMAEAIDVKLSSDDEKVKRPEELSEALGKKKKFVLFLDDVWKNLQLEKVGISQTMIERAGCKVIMTSRQLDVCRRMGCNKFFKVNPLSKGDAWNLFKKNIGNEKTLRVEVHKIAQSVCDECAGLPLAINAVASSMRSVDDVFEWNDVLRTLKEAKEGLESMDDEVFPLLKLSYDRLNYEQVQYCFLYCATYPEDWMVDREELINMFINVGLISEATRRASFDRALTILKKLEDVCLLEGMGGISDEQKYMKMHDLIRDMAIRITESKFMVKSKKSLSKPPQEVEWVDGLETVSLMSNDIKELSISPKCCSLRTLLLNNNYGLSRIRSSFFSGLPGLTGLNLSHTAIKMLPETVSGLANLKALILRNCCRLVKMPSLARLTALRELDLESTAVGDVPHGMETLVNLTYLNLRCYKLRKLPVGILPKLSRLQHFQIIWPQDDPSVLVKGELGGLQELEMVEVEFDWDNYMIFAKSLAKPNRYSITLKGSKMLPSVLVEKEKGIHRLIRITNFETPRGETFLLPADLQSLHLSGDWSYGWMCPFQEALNPSHFPGHCEEQSLTTRTMTSHEPFSHLKSLIIDSRCCAVRLIDKGLLPLLPNLEELVVKDCQKLEVIMGAWRERSAEICTESNEDDYIDFPKQKLKEIVGEYREWRFCMSPHDPFVLRKKELKSLIKNEYEKWREWNLIAMIKCKEDGDIDLLIWALKEILGPHEYWKDRMSEEWIKLRGPGYITVPKRELRRKIKEAYEEWRERILKLKIEFIEDGTITLPKWQTDGVLPPFKYVSEAKAEHTEDSSVTLPKLRRLRLVGLPALMWICDEKMLVCDSLEELEIADCPRLKNIPLSLKCIDGHLSPPPALLHITVGHCMKAFTDKVRTKETTNQDFDDVKLWWELLKWNNPDAKNVLQPFVRTCGEDEIGRKWSRKLYSET